ncbi:hypothetical protein LPJ61_002287 [Coemansia biformis]|uniref:FAS1 domain-containing protein n=1 Tax=Coemansia biformis TaxID=1286918 RepID=A0A9W8CZT4_9FUNG|nr:hypothetical protein LPJ61_002287 [Coemansia biformis]
MLCRLLTALLTLVYALLLGAAQAADAAIPFENLAQNLPEAFSALEAQFQDAGFRSLLTSQLNNPQAVDMFQSLIHDPKAASSISALLDDPSIQSSLSAQFVENYLAPQGTSASSNADRAAQATNDLSSHHMLDLDSSLKSGKHSLESAASQRPRAVVIGCLLTALLGAFAPHLA